MSRRTGAVSVLISRSAVVHLTSHQCSVLSAHDAMPEVHLRPICQASSSRARFRSGSLRLQRLYPSVCPLVSLFLPWLPETNLFPRQPHPLSTPSTCSSPLTAQHDKTRMSSASSS